MLRLNRSRVRGRLLAATGILCCALGLAGGQARAPMQAIGKVHRRSVPS